MPGRYLCGRLTPPTVERDFPPVVLLVRTALEASSLRGALPPVERRAVCLVLAILADDGFFSVVLIRQTADRPPGARTTTGMTYQRELEKSRLTKDNTRRTETKGWVVGRKSGGVWENIKRFDGEIERVTLEADTDQAKTMGSKGGREIAAALREAATVGGICPPCLNVWVGPRRGGATRAAVNNIELTVYNGPECEPQDKHQQVISERPWVTGAS